MADSDAKALNQKLVLELQRCMSGRGFDVSLPPIPLNESVFSLKSRYGAIPTDDPQTWGYREPEPVVDPAADPRDLTQDEMIALYGASMVDENSDSTQPLPCFPTAMRVVYGNINGLAGLDGYSELVQLQLESNDALYADDQAVQLVASWSDCMSQNGFSFTNWWDAPTHFLADPHSTGEISAGERATASADFECRKTTHLESGLLDIESEIQTDLLEDHQGVIETFQAAKEALATE